MSPEMDKPLTYKERRTLWIASFHKGLRFLLPSRECCHFHNLCHLNKRNSIPTKTLGIPPLPKKWASDIFLGGARWFTQPLCRGWIFDGTVVRWCFWVLPVMIRGEVHWRNKNNGFLGVKLTFPAWRILVEVSPMLRMDRFWRLSREWHHEWNAASSWYVLMT